jgi:hypothetical protein
MPKLGMFASFMINIIYQILIYDKKIQSKIKKPHKYGYFKLHDLSMPALGVANCLRY